MDQEASVASVGCGLAVWHNRPNPSGMLTAVCVSASIDLTDIIDTVFVYVSRIRVSHNELTRLDIVTAGIAESPESSLERLHELSPSRTRGTTHDHRGGRIV